MKTKFLYLTGFAVPILFWITLFISGLIYGDYNHLTRMVSELGTIGTTSRIVFEPGLLLCSILSLIFVISLYKTCRHFKLNILPVILILTYSFSIAGAAIFPLPLMLHEIMGMPSVLLIFSPLLSFFLWKNNKSLPFIKLFSLFSFILMLLGFLVYLPDFMGNYIGLKQRFFHIGWSVWFIYLSFILLNLNKNKLQG